MNPNAAPLVREALARIHEIKSARDEALARLAAVREYVDDPGNWSALDGRRQVLLDLIDGAA